MRRRGHHTLCYLDDFVGAAADATTAERAYADILRVSVELGLELSHGKCVPPTTEIDWLGFHLSTTKMSITIPEDKLQEVLRECEAWKTKKLVATP